MGRDDSGKGCKPQASALDGDGFFFRVGREADGRVGGKHGHEPPGRLGQITAFAPGDSFHLLAEEPRDIHNLDQLPSVVADLLFLEDAHA